MFLNLYSFLNEVIIFGGGYYIFLWLLCFYGCLNLISFCKKEVIDRIGLKVGIYILC